MQKYNLLNDKQIFILKTGFKFSGFRLSQSLNPLRKVKIP